MASAFKSSILKIGFFILISSGISFFYWANTHPLYAEYLKLSEYRRLHPEFIPSSSFLQFTSAGHTTTYADAIWISLIQYIGDNIASRSYTGYAPVLLDRIYALHPSFAKPYEISMLLLPTIFSGETGTGAEAKREESRIVLKKLEEKLGNICDMEKIGKILQVQNIRDIWTLDELKNPCRTSSVPFYMAFHYYNDLSENEKAKEYYMIAAAHEDAPMASRFLIGLMDGDRGEYLTAAFTLITLATDGHDATDSQECIRASLDTTKTILQAMEGTPIDQKTIQTIELTEKRFAQKKSTQEQSIEIQCSEYYSRATKQIYLSYIAQKAKSLESKKGSPIVSSDEIRKLDPAFYIPSLSASEDHHFYFDSRTNVWEYTIPAYAPIGSR